MELRHHGIKGMHWGVRRYQNYDGTRIKKSEKNVSKSQGAGVTNDSKGSSFVEKHGDMHVNSGMAGGGEEVAAYAVSLAAMVAANLVVGKITNTIQRKRKKRELEERKSLSGIESMDKCPKLKKPMSSTESMKLTNPGYPNEGSTMNCTFCTTAMVLRKKGYDVRASKSVEGWFSDDLFKATFNSPQVRMPFSTKRKDVLGNLAKNGEGSYGNLAVAWTLGGRHSIYWEVTNGKTHIYDGQSGEEYTKNERTTAKFLDSINPRDISYNRLDNCEPTDYALACVTRIDKDD